MSRKVGEVAALQAKGEAVAEQDRELSVADLTFFPNYLARRSMVEELGGLTHLRRWADQMAARPAVERMMKIG
jgi:glutathione S-transferase